MRKIVIASDSFKGSLSSSEVADAACTGIHDIYPDCQVIKINMADGGEGMLAALSGNLKAELITVNVHDPLGRLIDACYMIAEDHGTKTAMIEMAQASGLTLINEEERNPLVTSSYGTGEIIMDAFRKGCRNFIIGIGGSATNDGGSGMLEALGYQFFDSNGERVTHCTGERLAEINHVDMSRVDPELIGSEFTVACDVDVFFTGENGATHIFAAQKGADEAAKAILEEGMLSFERVIEKATGIRLSFISGAGAAGGVGGALHAFLRGEMKSGAETILDMTGFDKIIADADLVITGEGRIDNQTFMGKGPYRIASRAYSLGIPVIAIAGIVDPIINETESSIFMAVLPVSEKTSTPEERYQAMIPSTATMNIRHTISDYLAQFSKNSV